MKVIFFDMERETYERVENVCQLSFDYKKDCGRMRKVWFVHTFDGECKTYKCKRYELARVED